ncbi:MAG: tRNA (adenosine(37)-N6)-threonylcarbamoyltransferase complex transferase subunit TsaD [Bacteroidia bacterium]|nr:tRNA (adenosine(37)-N6)-threonylcarbamoyltransferase complex transferase subunit TsaD [Bacteroidia bacterium]
MTILGIESSCDETSAAVLRDGTLLSNIISSQLFHTDFGGVVPELASRAHLRAIVPIIQAALDDAGVTIEDVDAVAATQGPGLIGSLLVGLNTGKAIAAARGLPFIGVNHVEAHLYSAFLGEEKPDFPYLALAVSGGHTLLVLVHDTERLTLLGGTIDDAAGEAFDKVAKMLGLGFPGGPLIDALAQEGNAAAIAFPRPLLDEEGYRFSFSGLKTSVLYHLRRRAVDGILRLTDAELRDICASFQQAVVDILVGKMLRAAAEFGIRDLAVAGGVSANAGLGKALRARAGAIGKRVFIPPPVYSTDNAAMIALLASFRLSRARKQPQAPAFARLAGTLFHETP